MKTQTHPTLHHYTETVRGCVVSDDRHSDGTRLYTQRIWRVVGPDGEEAWLRLRSATGRLVEDVNDDELAAWIFESEGP